MRPAVVSARPRELIDTTLAGRPPSATTLGVLYDLSQGSRSACAVALAQRLPCDGFVALVDTTTSSIFFSARARDTRPYAWKGDPVPAGHPLRVAPVTEKGVTGWPYPDGEHRQFYLSALAEDDLVYAVFAENDLWNVAKLHFSDVGRPDRGYLGTINCPTCGYSGNTRWWPASFLLRHQRRQHQVLDVRDAIAFGPGQARPFRRSLRAQDLRHRAAPRPPAPE